MLLICANIRMMQDREWWVKMKVDGAANTHDPTHHRQLVITATLQSVRL